MIYLKALHAIENLRLRIHSRLIRGAFALMEPCSIHPSVRIDHPEFMTIGAGTLILGGGWLYATDRRAQQPGAPQPELVIGRNVYIGHYCHLVCGGALVVGDHVLIADYVHLADELHGYEDVDMPPLQQPLKIGRLEIGAGTWIGDHAVIAGNLRVGKHCVIGANAVVTHDIPDYCVAVGVPARVIKRYSIEEQAWVSANPPPLGE